MAITIKLVGNDRSVTGYAIDAQLPQITGTEKQIAWAERLRASFVAEINKKTNAQAKTHGLDVPPMNWDSAADMDLANALLAKVQAQFAGRPADLMAAVLGKTEARFWIDQAPAISAGLVQAVLKAAAK